jgi:hypothetical protein
VKAIVLINLCAREYNDVGFVRIKKSDAVQPNWLDLLNDAQRAVALVRPDSNSVTSSVLLVAGTRQPLPSGSQRLLKVNRNMGVDGTTAGRVIRLVDHATQDDVDLDWHLATAGVRVKDIVYDDKKDPLTFFVRPQMTPPWYVELILSKLPVDVTDPDNGLITLPDVYSGPMQAWMLHRAYAMQTQAAGLLQRSQFYFSSFFQQLGVKLRGDLFVAQGAAPQLPAQAAA